MLPINEPSRIVTVRGISTFTSKETIENSLSLDNFSVENVAYKFNHNTGNFRGILDIYFYTVEDASQFVTFHIQRRTAIENFYVLFDYKKDFTASKKSTEEHDFDFFYQLNANLGQYDISESQTSVLLLQDIDILNGSQEIVDFLTTESDYCQIYSAIDKFSRQFLGFMFVAFKSTKIASANVEKIKLAFPAIKISFANAIDLQKESYWDETVILDMQLPSKIIDDFYSQV